MWGEFLDSEWLEPWPERPTVVDPITLDPWRERYPHAWLVERDFLESIVQIERWRFCLTDVEKNEEILGELHAGGLREPLRLVVDALGRIVLWDGHHRLLLTRDMSHFKRMPVVFEDSEKIKTGGLRALDARTLTELMSSTGPSVPGSER